MKRFIILIAVCVVTSSAWALSTGEQVKLTGQAIAGADTLGGAKITITLVGGACWTTNDLMPSFTTITYATSAGNWEKYIVGTDSIRCAGGVTPTYTVQISHPVLDLAGQVIKYEGLRIPANNAQATTLKSIVNQQ